MQTVYKEQQSRDDLPAVQELDATQISLEEIEVRESAVVAYCCIVHASF